jgi:hypothetical protein
MVSLAFQQAIPFTHLRSSCPSQLTFTAKHDSRRRRTQIVHFLAIYIEFKPSRSAFRFRELTGPSSELQPLLSQVASQDRESVFLSFLCPLVYLSISSSGRSSYKPIFSSFANPSAATDTGQTQSPSASRAISYTSHLGTLPGPVQTSKDSPQSDSTFQCATLFTGNCLLCACLLPHPELTILMT